MSKRLRYVRGPVAWPMPNRQKSLDRFGGVVLMTEAEWLECTDPAPMLEYIQGTVNDRKLRLFMVACCRRIWHLFSEDRDRTAVEIAEQYADRLVSPQELEVAFRAY